MQLTVIRPPHRLFDLLPREALLNGFAPVRTVNIHAILLAHLLCLLIQHDCRSCFRNREEMDYLDDDSEDELDVEVPVPAEVLLDRATADAADHAAKTRPAQS